MAGVEPRETLCKTPEALSQVLGRRDPTGLDRGGFFL